MVFDVTNAVGDSAVNAVSRRGGSQMSVFVGIGFLIWILLTITIHVSKPLANVLARFDLFAFLPVWAFFAPNPSVVDYHLLYRDNFHSGQSGPFLEVPECIPKRGAYSWIWHPGRRIRKVVFDAIFELTPLVGQLEPDEIKSTMPYLILENYIIGLPAAADVRSRQFIIVAWSGFDETNEPDLAFVSDFHSIPCSMSVSR